MWFSSPCGTKLFTVNLDLWACQFMCQALYVSVWCSWYGSLLSQVLWSLQNTLTSISPSEPQGSSADKPRRYNHKPPSTGIGSPPPPWMSQGVRNGGSRSLNSYSIAVSPMPVSFHIKQVLSSKTYKRNFLPLLFRETWAIFTHPAALLFFGELPLLYFCWYWCHCHREMGSESPSLGQNLSCHTAYLDLVTHIWKLRDYRFSSIHPKGRVDLFLLLRSANIWCCPS